MNGKAGTPREAKRIVGGRGFFSRLRILRPGGSRDEHGDEGGTLVEMALVCGVLLFMIFGIVEVSIGLYTYHYLSDAAREGSRWAMVRGSLCNANTPGLDHCNAASSDISTYVKSLGYLSNDPRMTVTATWYTPSATPVSWSLCSTGTCNQPGYLVKVQVKYSLPLIIPWWPNGGNVALQSSSQMVISQ